MKKYLNFYNILLAFVFALSFFAFLAPIFMALGFDDLARPVYAVYSFFCHQLHYRSLHIYDYQVAWCTRDTFIWLGMLVAGVSLKFFRVRSFKWYEIILFLLPMAFDGGIQMIATVFGLSSGDSEIFYSSTNLTRMLTGSILGLGVGLWIFSTIEELDLEQKSKDRKRRVRKYILFLLAFIGLFVFYIFLIRIWAWTSTEYKPENFLDSNVKLPADQQEWFLRRKNATCPASMEEGNLFVFDCEE